MLSVRFLVAVSVSAVSAFGLSFANAQQVGDAFVVYNVDTGEIRMNPGNAGISQGNGISAYAIRANPSIIQFSSTATDFSYLSGNYSFDPVLGNVTPSDDNGLAAVFYTLFGPNVVNGPIGYFNHNNLVLDTAAVAGSGGAASWGPGNGGVVASEIPGTYFGTPEWSFGTVGSTGMSLSDALTAFDATEQGGLSSSNNMIYGIDGAPGTQYFRVYAVPEPSTIGLAAVGVIGSLGSLRIRRRRRKSDKADATIAA
jgi:hypothetical protein